MDTPEAIERAAELGMLAGQDYAKALANLGVAQAVRGLVHARITDIVATFDDHNPLIEDDGTYACWQKPCRFRGQREEWERHLADKLADALAGA